MVNGGRHRVRIKKKRKRRMSNNVEKKKTPATLNDEVKTKRMQPQKRREYLSCQR